MIRASIDIGSNSVLLLAAEIDPTVKIIGHEYLNESFITSLGKDLDKTKRFHPESMNSTLEALGTYKKLLEKIKFPTKDVIVTATEASRVAENAKSFYEKVKADTGFNVQIITSEGEAHYTALGVISSINANKENNIVVMDIGGASTELIKIQVAPFKIIESISLPIGSVRASDWLNQGILDEKFNELFKVDLSSYETPTLICVAGSMTAMASMYLGQTVYDDQKVDGLDLTFLSFVDFASDLQKTNVQNLLMLFPFLGKRAPMVGCGSKIAVEIGKLLKIDKIKISTRGLRYGTVLAGGIDERYSVR